MSDLQGCRPLLAAAREGFICDDGEGLIIKGVFGTTVGQPRGTGRAVRCSNGTMAGLLPAA
jgi:hypothetical protein